MISHKLTIFRLAVVGIIVMLVLVGMLYVDQVRADTIVNWYYTGSLNDARVFGTATLLQNGKVLVAGGEGISGLIASAELYDPATGIWTRTGDMNAARGHFTATLLPNGKVLVAGGDGISGLQASAELYNPDTGTWSYTGSMNEARSAHTATLLFNEKVLVVGGYGLVSTELYNPATGLWSYTGNLNNSRDSHSAVRLQNGKILIAGGYHNDNGTTSAELYDPDTGIWSNTGSMNDARSWPTATLLPNGKVLVAGSAIFCSSLASAELYDPDLGNWSYTGSMNTARGAHTEILLPDGKVLVAGGYLDCGYTNGSELYDPDSGIWSNTGSMNDARAWHSATLLPNGGVLVAGGPGPLATTELYFNGAFLYPPALNGFAEAGKSLTYTLQMVNLTGETDSYTLTVLSGNTFTTTLSDELIGPIEDGTSITFTASVEVPPGSQPGDSDSATIQATSVNSPTLTVEATINTTVSSGELAYVPMSSANALALIDTVLHTNIDSIDMAQFGCDFPQRARLNIDGTELYVMCENSHNIVVLETSDLSLVTTIDRSDYACTQDVAFVQFGAYALASSNPCSGGPLPIDVIDTATHTIVQSIPSDHPITSIAAHPYLPLAYAACWDGGVCVINTNTFTVQTIIPYDGWVDHVQPSPDGQWVYASEYNGNGLAKINVNSNMVVDTLPGYGKHGLDISPDGETIYASEAWDGVVHVIDTTNMELITTIAVGGITVENELTCDGSELYIARESTTSVPVIDTQTYSITYDIPIPGRSSGYGIAICPQYVVVKPTEVTITGPEIGLVGEDQDFNAQVEPISTTLPLTYTWQASGQTPITNTGGLTDTVSFTWDVLGTQLITVTASNLAGSVSSTHVITISPPIFNTYLPLVIKSSSGILTPTQPSSLLGDGEWMGLVIVGIVGMWKRRGLFYELAGLSNEKNTH